MEDHGHEDPTAAGTDARRMNPFALPEILSKVLSFLDRPSLQTCMSVCYFWRSNSLPILWQQCFINERLLCDPSIATEDNGQQFDDDRQHYSLFPVLARNSHRIRSLTIKRHSTPFYQSRPLLTPHLQYLDLPNLTKLVHLHVVVDEIDSPGLPPLSDFYDRLQSIVIANPQLQDLELWHRGAEAFETNDPFVQTVRATAGGTLRRLSIKANFSHGGVIMVMIKYLMEVYEMHQQQQHQRHQPQQHPGSFLTAPDNHGDHSGNKIGGGDVLEELVFQNMHLDGGFPPLDASLIKFSTGSLPIRALTILDLETCTALDDDGNYFDVPEEDMYGPVPRDALLIILRKCPLLERLRISFDTAVVDEPSPKEFKDFVLEIMSDRYSEEIWVPEPENFVSELHQACPNLKAIDFGMKFNLTEKHWEDIMAVYGSQLESLNVSALFKFTSQHLMDLIGPPIHHPSRIMDPGMHCLIDLNISGVNNLHGCGSMLFKHMATLKRLKARSTPMDGSDLIGFDWVCKDMELLEILVLVPKQRWLRTKEWTWNDDSKSWHLISKEDDNDDEGDYWARENEVRMQLQRNTSTQRTQRGKSDGESEEDDGYGEKYGSKRRLKSFDAKDKRKGKGKRKKTEDGLEKSHRTKSNASKQTRQKEENTDRENDKNWQAESARKERKKKGDRSEDEAGKRKKKEKKYEKDKRDTRDEEPRRRSKKKKRGDSVPDSESHDLQKASTDSNFNNNKSSSRSNTSAHPPNPRTMRPKEYQAFVQIQICEQLGRLTKLRSLTLEGELDTWFEKKEWTCMTLTLATGLDRLEPLQNSLERLVVYQLHEELCGRAEVEWMARHWVHHQNPRWLQAQVQDQAQGSPLSVLGHGRSSDHHDNGNGGGDVAKDYFIPSPKFKELIGISVRGQGRSALEAHLSLDWLQRECRMLVIEKDNCHDEDDFSYGAFQDA